MGLIAFAKSSHGRPTLGRVKLSSHLRFGVLRSGEHDDSSSSLAGRLGAVELPGDKDSKTSSEGEFGDIAGSSCLRPKPGRVTS